MKFKYDTNIYSLANMYNKVNLKYAKFYCIDDDQFHTFYVEEYHPNTSMISVQTYEHNTWIKKIHEVQTERIALCFNDAVEYEYNKLLSELNEEQREFMKDLVSYKEHSAAIAGYNGCI